MCAALLSAVLLLGQSPPEAPVVILVLGAPGSGEYRTAFSQWADRWSQAAAAGGAGLVTIGGSAAGDQADREQLQEALNDFGQCETGEPLWLVLIGHGTFDGREARFNLQGPDVTAGELARWLEPARRPVAVVNCASCSGPFINQLSALGRIVVTATKSGDERSFARFGDYFSAALNDLTADLDKDQQVSLLEAFLFAARNVAEFYQREARLATEHALLDDNGDGLGTRAEWFRGVRAVQAAKDGAELDGLRANQLHLVRNLQERQLEPQQRARRDQLEAALEQLRGQKSQLSDEQYDRLLEPLMIQLAELYEQTE